MSIQRRKRPRALTLTLPDEKQPFLVLLGQRYTLRNFSEEGVGLWMIPPAPYGLTPGTKVSGDIVIENHIHPVQLEVCHVSERCVGLRISHKSVALSTLFRRLLEPTIYAATLIARSEAGKLWFYSGGDTDLIVWYDGNHIIQALQLCWLGKWVYRKQFHRPETGILRDGVSLNEGKKIPEEELLERHSIADQEYLQQAAQFLASVPHPLPGYLFWQFLETGEQVTLPENILVLSKVA